MPLPHERDESPDPAPPDPRPEMQRAAGDLARGLVDTEGRKQAVEIFEQGGENRTRSAGRRTRHPYKRLQRR